MDQIMSILDAVVKGAKNPYMAAVGAVIGLLLYFFVLAQKGILRDKKAEGEKDEQKGESNIEIENTNASGEGDIRDRLEHRT